MNDKEQRLIAIAKAEDTYDLLQHISWTDVIKPALQHEVEKLSKILVAEALGTPIAGGRTREQVAGICFGIQYISSLFERILREGKKALTDLQNEGIKL